MVTSWEQQGNGTERQELTDRQKEWVHITCTSCCDQPYLFYVHDSDFSTGYKEEVEVDVKSTTWTGRPHKK